MSVVPNTSMTAMDFHLKHELNKKEVTKDRVLESFQVSLRLVTWKKHLESL
jgi:hypothetical protein